MYAVMVLEMKKNIQDRGLLFWAIGLPILFTVLFIAIFTSGLEGAEQKDVILSIVPGYVVMFVFFIIITMVDRLMKDLDIGMTARLASTPLRQTAYLFGKWIPYMIVVFAQIIVLLAFGKLVYNIPMAQPVTLLIIALALTFTVTGIGLAIALIVKTFNMGLAITQILALGGALLSGLWVPVEFMPHFMQMISKIFPQYWAHQALQDAMSGGLNISGLLITVAILIGFGALGFGIALMRYPNFLKRAKS